MQQKKLFWIVFSILLVLMAVIQFVPSPPSEAPPRSPADEQEAHLPLNPAGSDR